MRKIIPLFVIIVVTASSTFVMARMFRPNQIPNGDVKSCLTCHVVAGGPRNAFGTTIENGFLSTPGAAGNVVWGPSLALIDSAGDGFSNGRELQDPEGMWAIGQPAPGTRSLVTNPGDPNDFPNTTSVETLPGIADQFGLEKNYPNPFNPSTTIAFSVPRASQVRLDIYSITGQHVRELLNEAVESGNHSTRWNGRDDAGSLVESGTYMYRLTAGDFTAVRRMVMIK